MSELNTLSAGALANGRLRVLPDSLDFDDLEPIVLPVKYKGAEYVLKEATADVAVKYRNAAMKAARMVDGKLVGIEGGADVEPILVAGCLFLVERKGDGTVVHRPVDPKFVRGLPSRVLKPLFDTAKRISELEEKETEADLERQIAALREKLAALRKTAEAGGVEDPEGNASGATATTSA